MVSILAQGIILFILIVMYKIQIIILLNLQTLATVIISPLHSEDLRFSTVSRLSVCAFDGRDYYFCSVADFGLPQNLRTSLQTLHDDLDY
jgi:hypothetical protein